MNTSVKLRIIANKFAGVCGRQVRGKLARQIRDVAVQLEAGNDPEFCERVAVNVSSMYGMSDAQLVLVRDTASRRLAERKRAKEVRAREEARRQFAHERECRSEYRRRFRPTRVAMPDAAHEQACADWAADLPF